LAHLDPSEANDASTYEGLQASQQERILDDCPKPDIGIPPFPLLYAGFGEFHDIVTNSSANPLGPLATNLMDRVDELADDMCSLGHEKERQAVAERYLEEIFSLAMGVPRVFTYPVGNGTQLTTDGHLLASHDGPLFITEYKRQIATAEPQLAGYFIRLALQTSENTFLRWRQPALGLLIRGKLTVLGTKSLTQGLCQGRIYRSMVL